MGGGADIGNRRWLPGELSVTIGVAGGWCGLPTTHPRTEPRWRSSLSSLAGSVRYRIPEVGIREALPKGRRRPTVAWLPEVVQDVTDKIIAGDWFEREAPDGSRSFYVIGAEAYWDDVKTSGSYTDCLALPGPEVGPLAEHVVRSQVAGSRREDYVT